MRRLKLTRLNWDRKEPPAADEYFPGDPCPNRCHDEKGKPGVIGVYYTDPKATKVIRYLKCKTCGFLPDNKLIEPVLTSQVVTTT